MISVVTKKVGQKQCVHMSFSLLRSYVLLTYALLMDVDADHKNKPFYVFSFYKLCTYVTFNPSL